jgi:FlaA1/EpsC-like NDP-sugar epimerase
MAYFTAKKILVTGGTGSIGSKIVEELLHQNPSVIRIYSRDEHKQFLMEQRYRECENVRFFIGDVRDKERLYRAMEGVQIVFHAAALKHVPVCEYNPFEAIQTNVFGTQNVVNAAMDLNVEKVVLISTDKAASPLNVMGATKLLAERLVTAATYYKGERVTRFASVRFGNVLGSRGSVIPLFHQQIRDGRPITLTDPGMSRFMMSLKEAVQLVFDATHLMKGGEVFILKMPSIYIKDLVDVMIEELCPLYGRNPASMKLQIVGKRPGEKIYEVLMTREEAQWALETETLFILTPHIKIPRMKDKVYEYEGAKKALVQEYTSESAKKLDKPSIKRLLEESGLLCHQPSYNWSTT